MASEPIVSFFVGKLGDLLIEEARLLHEVRDQIKWIEFELRQMQRFLKDADQRRGEESVKSWVAEIREVSYAAEDVIDTFIYSQRRGHGFVGCVKRCSCIFRKVIARHKVGKEIRQIKQKINDISSRRLTYGIREINQGGQEASSSHPDLHKRRQDIALLEEPGIVGMEDDFQVLKERLINSKSSRCVVSIVGMGGSGKTTMAKKVYRDVSKNFQCHAFIYLSQQYRDEDVFKRILECVMSLSREEMDKLNKEDLGKKLRDHLSQKKYLVVIDDIWTREAWETLNYILPDGSNGSRVMLTTRKQEVALYADPSNPPHQIRLLNAKEGWELFLMKIFRSGNSCPSELEETGRQIVAKCHGLPLAIALLGSLLSTKDKTLREWYKILQSGNWHLAQTSEQFMLQILALSYYDLPPYLKPCFLYLSLFPEDYEIRSKRLIKLWIAEGFVEQRGELSLEDVAEDYLLELIGRCMIQVATKRPDGSVRTCRIHDLLRDHSAYQAGENNFCTIQGDRNTSANTSSTSVRRLALHDNTGIDEIINSPISTLRSVLCFSYPYHVDWSKLFNRSGKLVRVLDGGRAYQFFPKKIGGFFHLRYLRGRDYENTLSCIGNFSNLQTLELMGYGTLPNAICNLERLRHLHAYRFSIDGNARLNNLRNLQTLCLRSGNWIENGLSELVNLKKLGIFHMTDQYHGALSDSIKKLQSLRSFKIDGTEIPCMSFIQHSHLYKLYLSGRIGELPECPPKLLKLTLNVFPVKQDAIATLEKLPKLKILRLLKGSYCSKKMICSSGGFPQLETLVLEFSGPIELIVEEGAMPSLKRFQVSKHTVISPSTIPRRLQDLLFT